MIRIAVIAVKCMLTMARTKEALAPRRHQVVTGRMTRLSDSMEKAMPTTMEAMTKEVSQAISPST